MIGWVAPDRVEPVAVAVKKVLLDGSVRDLTLRNIATYVGCSPSTLAHRFGSMDNLIAHVAQWLGEQWTDALRIETWSSVDGFLDTYERTGEQLRPWLTMCEIGRGDPLTGGVVASAERDQRRYLEGSLGEGVDQADRDLWIAVAHGLHHALSAGTDPLPIERARAAMLRFEELWGRPR
jgi:AcrR family transcriptional regulator